MKDNRIGLVKTDTKLLYDLLAETKEGEIVPYSKMLEITFSSNVNKIRSSITSALKILQKEKEYVFQCVIGEGYKRLTDTEIANTGKKNLKKIRKTASRSNKVLACVKFNNLSNEDKIKHNAHSSIFGVIEFAASPTKIKQIENKVKEINNTLSLEETLNFFK